MLTAAVVGTARVRLGRGRTIVAIVSVLSGACGRSSPAAPDVPSSSSGAATADLIFCVTETNRYRAMVNRPALTRSLVLEAHAALSAAADAVSGRAHGYTLDTNRGGGLVVLENQLLRVPYAGNVQGVIRDGWALFWREGPGGIHYDNLTSTAVRETGCGVYVAGPAITITLDFR